MKIQHPVVVDAGALQLVINCLTRDAELSPVRGEILKELHENSMNLSDYHIEVAKEKERRRDLGAEPCPSCGTPLKSASGGGVRCPKPGCGHWFCY